MRAYLELSLRTQLPMCGHITPDLGRGPHHEDHQGAAGTVHGGGGRGGGDGRGGIPRVHAAGEEEADEAGRCDLVEGETGLEGGEEPAAARGGSQCRRSFPAFQVLLL